MELPMAVRTVSPINVLVARPAHGPDPHLVAIVHGDLPLAISNCSKRAAMPGPNATPRFDSSRRSVTAASSVVWQDHSATARELLLAGLPRRTSPAPVAMTVAATSWRVLDRRWSGDVFGAFIGPHRSCRGTGVSCLQSSAVLHRGAQAKRPLWIRKARRPWFCKAMSSYGIATTADFWRRRMCPREALRTCGTGLEENSWR